MTTIEEIKTPITRVKKANRLAKLIFNSPRQLPTRADEVKEIPRGIMNINATN